MMSLSFQDIILTLQQFWSKQGCAVLQPYDTEVGAGTLHPATCLRALGPDPWRVAYVQPSRRPADGRYGENPNRLQHYYQFQVLLKPYPENIQDLYLESIQKIGVDLSVHDVRFVEDDWENPTVGASGLGWEVWLDGMEVTQFTYFQQVGGLPVDLVSGEITYGLERLAMYVQQIDNVYELDFNGAGITYGDIFKENERQQSTFNFEVSDPAMLERWFEDAENQSKLLLNRPEGALPLAAYDWCLKASHLFNLLDARGRVSATQRPFYIARVRELAKGCAQKWVELNST